MFTVECSKEFYDIWTVSIKLDNVVIARQRLHKQAPTRNNATCFSVDEYYSSLLGSSQRANELAG
jgi:hypothetical protein